MSEFASKLNLRKNIAFAVLAFAVNALLVFVSYRLVIHQGGLETVGLWSTLFAWTSLIRIGDFGMASASLRFAALCNPVTEKEKLHRYIETGIITNGGLFLALTLIGYAIISWMLPSIVQVQAIVEARRVLPLMMVGFFLMNMAGVIAGSMQGLHLGYMSAQLSVAGSIIQLIVVLLLVPGLGLTGMALGQIAQYSVMCCCSWYVTRRHAGIRSAFPHALSIEALKEMLSFSVKAQFANIANGLFEPLSKIWVGHFGGLHLLGIYELAYKTVTMTRSLPAAGVTATLPAMTKLLADDISEARRLYTSTSSRNRLVTALLFFTLTLVSPAIAILWIGHLEYRYVTYILLLCSGFFFNSLGAPAYLLGAASGKMKSNIVTASASLLVLVLLGGLIGFAFEGDGVVVVVALTLAAAGWTIKLLNEELLSGLQFSQGDRVQG